MERTKFERLLVADRLGNNAKKGNPRFPKMQEWFLKRGSESRSWSLKLGEKIGEFPRMDERIQESFLKWMREYRRVSQSGGENLGKCPSENKSYPSILLSFLNQLGKQVSFGISLEQLLTTSKPFSKTDSAPILVLTENFQNFFSLNPSPRSANFPTKTSCHSCTLYTQHKLDSALLSCATIKTAKTDFRAFIA